MIWLLFDQVEKRKQFFSARVGIFKGPKELFFRSVSRDTKDVLGINSKLWGQQDRLQLPPALFSLPLSLLFYRDQISPLLQQLRKRELSELKK